MFVELTPKGADNESGQKAIFNLMRVNHFSECKKGGSLIFFAGDNDDYIIVEETYDYLKKLIPLVNAYQSVP